MSEILNRDYYQGGELASLHDLKPPRIGFNNYMGEATLSSSDSDVATFEHDGLKNPLSYDLWKPAAFPYSLHIDLGARRFIDYFGFAAHSLGGCSVQVLTSEDDTNYLEVDRITFTNDNDAMILTKPILVRYVRLVFSGWRYVPRASLNFVTAEYSEHTDPATNTGGAHCGVLYMGQSLKMPYSIYGGHTPAPLSEKVESVPTKSNGGHWLGRSIVRRSNSEQFAFKYLGAAWYRDNFQAFVEHAKTLPYFALWRPIEFADEAIFGTTTGTIAPQNTGPGDMMSVSFNVEGV